MRRGRSQEKNGIRWPDLEGVSIDFVDFPPPPGPSPVYALVFSLTRHSRGSWSPRKNVNGQLGLLVRFVQSDRFVNFALRTRK